MNVLPLATLAISVILLTVAGCATASKTYGPDGSESYAINCSGSAMAWDQCYAKAGEKCGTRGYEIVSKDGDQSASFGASSFGAFGAQNANRSLVVKCKTP